MRTLDEKEMQKMRESGINSPCTAELATIEREYLKYRRKKFFPLEGLNYMLFMAVLCSALWALCAFMTLRVIQGIIAVATLLACAFLLGAIKSDM